MGEVFVCRKALTLNRFEHNQCAVHRIACCLWVNQQLSDNHIHNGLIDFEVQSVAASVEVCIYTVFKRSNVKELSFHFQKKGKILLPPYAMLTVKVLLVRFNTKRRL